MYLNVYSSEDLLTSKVLEDQKVRLTPLFDTCFMRNIEGVSDGR